MSEALNIRLTKASAGSGKTYRLMQKIAELVEGGTDPSSILATTFTVKAANELKERIRGKLLEMGKEELAQKVSTGLIGTVNGICGRLLSEYAIEAGLSPQLDVLSDTNSRIIFQRAVAAAIKDKIVAFEPLAFRMGMLEEQCLSLSSGPDWWTSLIRMCDMARANGLDDAALAACEERSLAQVDDLYPGTEDFGFDDILKFVEPHMPLIETIANEDSPEREKANDGVIDFCERIVELRRERSWCKAMPGSKVPGNKKGEAADFGDVFKPLYDELRKRVYASKQLKQDAIEIVKAMFDMTRSCLAAYQDFKKRYGLIDFVDQEMRLLDLFERNEGFRAAFKERVKVIMVDEFQDTSPMQLALFLKMNELVGNTIWVGDPKQAIYGFRGTDPALMASVADAISTANPDNIDTLKYSWRSRDTLVRFSNAVFGESFKGTMKGQDIVLDIDWEHIKAKDKPKREGGEIESWVINQKAAPGMRNHYQVGLSELVEKYREAHKDIPLRDIAILTRTNAEASALAEELGNRGIPASAASGELNLQPICNLAMAAYRYAVDKHDTMSLATLVAFVMDDEDWFAHLVGGREEVAAEDGQTKVVNRTLEKWAEDPRIKVLDTRETRTPLELLDYVIGTFSLDEYAGRMTDPDRALRNLEALRALCVSFMTEAKLGGYPVTHAGFIDYYLGSDATEASCEGGDCIQVMTYHKSKGLEWPVVILTSLQKDASPDPFEIMVEQLEPFDAEKPLAGREIRAVFNAFGTSVSMFKESKEYQRVMPDATVRDLEERKRLMYVGMTRARDVLILAPQLNSRMKANAVDAKWLDSLSQTEELIRKKFEDAAKAAAEGKRPKTQTGPSMFRDNWRMADEDATEWTIAGEPFTVRSLFYDPPPETDEEPATAPEQEEAEPVEEGPEMAWCDKSSEASVAHVEASVAPSALAGADVPVEVDAVTDIGQWFSIEKTDENNAAVGNAMHGYYALAVKGGDDAELAKSLLERWGVAEFVDAEKLVKSGACLREYVNGKWPGAEIDTEVPVTLVNEKGQRHQGYIDLLVKTADGYVVLDHKTGLSRDYAAVARRYAGQLALYRQAIEDATGGKVLKSVLHLPACGVCVECKV